ncbi:MAG: ATP-binding protein [Treponema sp.]|nr:ATP-binding protein [Treponema sp.]
MQDKALRDALSAAEEANKAKTVFLSNMSHEIRTPMNAIIGLDRIALNDPDLSASTRDYLQKIGTSADHLLSIINEILDMTRIESGKMVLRQESFSLPKLLEQINVIIGGQCEAKGLTWNWRLIGEADEYYVGDDMKLKEILINILWNAVKFTPEGGEVTFTVEGTRRYEGKTVFRFVIKDTGIGMSRDYLPKIFDPFSLEDYSIKTKYGSTGLGMSITKSIVEMMNGDIKVDSEKNAGTTFTVTLTLNDYEKEADTKEEAQSGSLPTKSGYADLKGRRVLVAEDVEINADIIRMVLDVRGVETAIARQSP